jgi:hypothetical protein
VFDKIPLIEIWSLDHMCQSHSTWKEEQLGSITVVFIHARLVNEGLHSASMGLVLSAMV